MPKLHPGNGLKCAGRRKVLVSPGKEEDPCYSLSAIYWHLTRCHCLPRDSSMGEVGGAQWVPSLKGC